MTSQREPASQGAALVVHEYEPDSSEMELIKQNYTMHWNGSGIDFTKPERIAQQEKDAAKKETVDRLNVVLKEPGLTTKEVAEALEDVLPYL